MPLANPELLSAYYNQALGGRLEGLLERAQFESISGNSEQAKFLNDKISNLVAEMGTRERQLWNTLEPQLEATTPDLSKYFLGSGDRQGLLEQMENARQSARTANEERYAQALGDPEQVMGYTERYGNLMRDYYEPIAQEAGVGGTGDPTVQERLDTDRTSLEQGYTGLSDAQRAAMFGEGENSLASQYANLLTRQDQGATDLSSGYEGLGSEVDQAGDMSDPNSLMGRYSDMVRGQGQQYQGLEQGYGNLERSARYRGTDLLNQYGSLEDQQRSAYGSLRGGYGDLRTGTRSRMLSGDDSVQAGYGDALANQTGRLEGVGENYDEVLANVMGELEGRGAQAKEDIGRRFEKQRSGVDQDLMRRGMFNTSTGLNFERAVTEDESREQRRLEDTLRGERAGYQAQLGSQAASARERSAQQLGTLEYAGLDQRERAEQLMTELGLQGLTAGERFTDREGALGQDRLAAQERVNQINNAMQELGLSAGERFTGRMGDLEQALLGQQERLESEGRQIGMQGLASDQAMQQYLGALEQASLGQQERGLEALRQIQSEGLSAEQTGMALQQQLGALGLQAMGSTADAARGLSGDTLGLIERRTDVGPGLNDIANMLLSLGGNSGMLGQQSPLSYFQQPSSFFSGD